MKIRIKLINGQYFIYDDKNITYVSFGTYDVNGYYYDIIKEIVKKHYGDVKYHTIGLEKTNQISVIYTLEVIK